MIYNAKKAKIWTEFFKKYNDYKIINNAIDIAIYRGKYSCSINYSSSTKNLSYLKEITKKYRKKGYTVNIKETKDPIGTSYFTVDIDWSDNQNE